MYSKFAIEVTNSLYGYDTLRISYSIGHKDFAITELYCMDFHCYLNGEKSKFLFGDKISDKVGVKIVAIQYISHILLSMHYNNLQQRFI